MNKSLIILSFIVLSLSACRNQGVNELMGDQNRKPFFEPIPHGMAFIKQGSMNIGPSDEEVDEGHRTVKTISIQSFWIDDTEITNNEYRQFTNWVRDSIARQILSESFPEFLITENKKGELLPNPYLNWEDDINWKNSDYLTALEELYVPEQDRLFNTKEIDTRKLNYDYYWIDLRQAAKRANSYNISSQGYHGSVIDNNGDEIPIRNRSSFLMHESTPVYPDTLTWVRDFTYSYNEPLTQKYFSHVAFDDYPVVGVTWKQAKAFCHWRTEQLDKYQRLLSATEVHEYRLPTELEWEYAARGGNQMTMYPWGSYYTRNQYGCFVANFKPLRGNYIADSRNSVTTQKVGTFDPNPYGLYDMAGNVAEWTSNAFAESAYESVNDMNPSYEYDALPDDTPALKRKVIRGGSWKDIAYYIQLSTRSFEYQDSAKSYIGFRCVRTSFKNSYYK